MPFAAIGNIIGGYLQGEAQKDAAETSAAAQLRAARLAAAQQAFRPVGVTTRFGTSQFTLGIPGVNAPNRADYRSDKAYQKALKSYNARLASEGRVTEAGYEVDPRLAAYQDRLQRIAEQGLTQAEAAQGQYAPLGQAASSLFGLGQQYLAQSPEDVAAQYLQRQQDLLAPARERQLAELRNQMFQTGRTGLAVGATGQRPGGGAGLGAANPELEAYYNALAQQDAALAAQAQQAGQQQLAFGTGLFGQGAGLLGQMQAGQVGALSPFTSYLGGVSALESLGQNPLDLATAIGAQASTAGANVGRSLLMGGLGAAQTLQAAAPYSLQASLGRGIAGIADNPYFQQGVKSLFGGGQPSNAPIEERGTGYGMGGGADTGPGYSWAY